MGGVDVILLDFDKKVLEIIANSNLIKKKDFTDDFETFLSLIKKKRYGTAIINPDLVKEKMEVFIEKLLLKKIPVLIVLGKYHDIEKAIDGLSAGAFDYFLKPTVHILLKEQKEKVRDEIIFKILYAKDSVDKLRLEHQERKRSLQYDFSSSSKKIIIIGTSTGGPQSLEQVIPMLPKEIPSPVLVVQHMPENFTKKLAESLDDESEMQVKEAEEGEEIKEGVCYIAKGNYHMELKKKLSGKVIISLNKKERMLGVRPSINITMESVAGIYRKNTIGVVLTGMGCDGTIGAKKIKENGGTMIVESEESSIIAGMPGSVIQSGYFDVIVDMQKILVTILQVLEV